MSEERGITALSIKLQAPLWRGLRSFNRFCAFQPPPFTGIPPAPAGGSVKGTVPPVPFTHPSFLAPRGVPPLGSPAFLRFASPPPDPQMAVRRAAWTAFARAHHRAAPRYGLLRPSASAPTVESDVAGTVPARARPSSSRLRCTLARLCASRSARNFQETFRCAETFLEVPIFSP